MSYVLGIDEAELLEIFPQYTPDYIPVWYASWQSYEEDGHMFIVEKNGVYYVQYWGYSVMADPCNDVPVWCPEKITEDEAIELMIEWENTEDWT